MSQKRNYSCSDADMLMAAKTIGLSFKENISELSTTRTDFTEANATDLLLRIDNATEAYLGVDNKKSLRSATASLIAIQVPAKRDLSYFKTQVDDDFKDNPSKHEEFLNTLGFTKHLKSVQTDSQEGLLNLLYAFRKNMSDTLKDEICSKGMAPALIDKIMGYANTFREANAAQETNKVTTKELTNEITLAFNSIYDEIIGICKKASSYYHYEPIKKEQFTFSKVLTNLGAARKAANKAIV